jgi:hypothetical protein
MKKKIKKHLDWNWKCIYLCETIREGSGAL